MSVIGDSGMWSDLFPGDLIPQILDLVIGAWARFEKPESTALEVAITRRFRALLRQERSLRRLTFRIERESPEDTPDSGEEMGRIDLRFSHGYREEVYFAFECKRLNVMKGNRRSSLAPEYVKEGLMRFVEGRYARDLDTGGMIGYVMDGDVPAAVKSVRKAVANRRETLRVVGSGLADCSFRPGHAQIQETEHEIGREFRVLHVFLPI